MSERVTTTSGAVGSRRVALPGALLGLGLAATVDEVVFHQILRWHHFYDRSTPAAGLVSDGILHAVSWLATVAALFLLADLRRRGPVPWRRWWGGVLAGAGAFQVYDGIVQHKLLDLHQVRYGVDLVPYDVAWNASGLLLLVAAAVLLRGRA
jgi:uncharacterized membrane protein